jgi:hypothetical protein
VCVECVICARARRCCVTIPVSPALYRSLSVSVSFSLLLAATLPARKWYSNWCCRDRSAWPDLARARAAASVPFGGVRVSHFQLSPGFVALVSRPDRVRLYACVFECECVFVHVGRACPACSGFVLGTANSSRHLSAAFVVVALFCGASRRPVLCDAGAFRASFAR